MMRSLSGDDDSKILVDLKNPFKIEKDHIIKNTNTFFTFDTKIHNKFNSLFYI
jgi:hypothetical protein